jgi:hypothetical protein
VVLYGCETWSLTSREEPRLKVFENRVLRRIFGPKRDEVVGGWGKLHNAELHSLYCSPSIYRMIKPHYGPGFDSASNRNEYQEADNFTTIYEAIV